MDQIFQIKGGRFSIYLFLVFFLNQFMIVMAIPQGNSSVNTELASKMAKVKRIFVESFGDDPIARTFQAMVINSITASNRFIVTENKEKADAILRGGVIQKMSQEFHSLGQGTAVAGNSSQVSGSSSGTVSGNIPGHVYGSSSGQLKGSSSGLAVAIDDSAASTETIIYAQAAVRLTTVDGDAIWGTTQESRGAKYKGALADVAEKITKQLLKDLEKSEHLNMQSK